MWNSVSTADLIVALIFIHFCDGYGALFKDAFSFDIYGFCVVYACCQFEHLPG